MADTFKRNKQDREFTRFSDKKFRKEKEKNRRKDVKNLLQTLDVEQLEGLDEIYE